MFGEQRTRTLLGPADPAMDRAVEPPRLSAHELIVRAEASPSLVPGIVPRRARTSRRLLLAGGAVVVAAGVVKILQPSTVDTPRIAGPPGTVLVPIAYQYDTGTSGAGPQLRALADRLVDAPYDGRTGRYTYHDLRIWGDPVMTSGDGRYVLGFGSERQIWRSADGTAQERVTMLDPQYPDQASRDYWQHHMPRPQGTRAPQLRPQPPQAVRPLPSDRAGLANLLQVRYGAGAVHKALATIYARYAVPRAVRADILRIVADVPGFVWRGAVTDRAGRAGVAITFDDPANDQQHLLVFEPRTGGLLGDELLTLRPKRLSTYQLILATDLTDRIG